MTTQVEKTVEVDVPVRAAYDQWTQFEEFPQFMSGVQEVRQVSDSLTHWVAQIAGVRREWDAAILEQVPDQKVAWAATTGATNAGAVHFQPLGAARTLVRLSLEYEPEGLVEKVGDFLNVVEKQAEGDLERFKSFIESRGVATGAWRGAVNEAGTVATPGVESASASRGDSGKAGVSGTAVAAGVAAGAAVAGAAAAVASNRSSGTGSPSGSESGFEGDPIEIGPTGGERSTLHTAPPTTGGVSGSAAASFDDDPGGDPVAVDPGIGVRGDSAMSDADSTTPGDPTVPRSPRDR
jgi:carbon monoxide dehydrogenase subunit G